MDPKLCFLLCGTPIIYIQKSICRCSWSDLMDQSKTSDSHCQTHCWRSGYYESDTNGSCGGEKTYSAFAENQFYLKHGHLLDFQLKFRSCELWNTSSNLNPLPIEIDELSDKPSSNKLERCAAACLDQYRKVQSIDSIFWP
ncbi:unnamed protein product [Adineta ricciae]|uniref:WSC domain-containing protein n=1 Tax=Adineta ricciae TaxID=249248 RepID=A0A813W0X6_ADIRI|nr:unnamed protein product [Adineta ricciae]